MQEESPLGVHINEVLAMLISIAMNYLPKGAKLLPENRHLDPHTPLFLLSVCCLTMKDFGLLSADFNRSAIDGHRTSNYLSRSRDLKGCKADCAAPSKRVYAMGNILLGSAECPIIGRDLKKDTELYGKSRRILNSFATFGIPSLGQSSFRLM